MSDPTRSVSSHRAVETYSIALDFAQRSSKPLAQQSRAADTVRISKEALDKAQQLKEREQIAPGPDYNPADEPDLTLEQVRRVFLAAIKKYHPDHCLNLSDEMREMATKKTGQIIEAYRSIQKVLF
jgi:DnaJ-domain-containing protein 1